MTSLSIHDPRILPETDFVADAWVPPQEAQDDPGSILDAWFAAMRLENTVVSPFAMTDPVGDYDPEFNPLELVDPSKGFNPRTNTYRWLAGYEDSPFLPEFTKARNPRDLNRIKSEIQRELDDRRAISEAGVLGYASLFAAGAADPLIFVPGGAAVKTVRGISVARTALKVGAITGGIVAVQEAALHQTQRTRTPEESAMVIGGSVLLGGVLGGATGLLAGRKFAKAAEEINQARIYALAQSEMPGAPMKDPMASGGLGRFVVSDGDALETLVRAAEKEGVDVPKSGINRFVRLGSPRAQVVTGQSQVAAEVGESLFQVPLKVAGVRTPDVENLVKQGRADLGLIHQKVDDLFVQHLSGTPHAKENVVGRAFGHLKRQDKLTWAAFDREVSRAVRGEPGAGGKLVNVGRHEVPQVQEAAQLYIDFMDEWAQKAVDIGLLPKEVLDNPGYLRRLYNRELLMEMDSSTGTPRFPHQEAFANALVEYEQKLLQESGDLEALSKFNHAAALKRAQQTVETILSTPEGRLFPGDAGLRGPLLDRTLKYPDAVMEPWLVNSARRLLDNYARTMIADTHIARRFGLQPARAMLEETRPGIIARMREATAKPTGEGVKQTVAEAKKAANAALKLLRERDDALLSQFVGGRMSKASRGFLQKQGVARLETRLQASRSKTARAIRLAKTDAEAAEILAKREEAIVAAFNTGNMNLALNRIAHDYDQKLASKFLTDKQRKKLTSDRARQFRNIRIMRDEIRGTLNITADPASIPARVARGARSWTYMAYGPMIVFSSMMDMVRTTMEYGLTNTLRTMTDGFTGGLKSLKLATDDAKLMLGPSEVVNGLRAKQLMDLDAGFVPHTRVERGIEKATHLFSIANLMSPWNQGMRNLISYTTSSFIVTNARKVKAGQAVPEGVLSRLRELGYNEDLLRRTADQFDRHAQNKRLHYAVNIGAWDDDAAKLALRTAQFRAQDLNLLRGSAGDRPGFLSATPETMSPTIAAMGQEGAKTVLMFMNYGLAANTRILARSLQYRDATALSGILYALAWGMLVTSIRRAANEREQPESMQEWVYEAVERSGVTGTIFDADKLLMAASNGKFGLSAMFDPGGRYFSPRTGLTAIAGAPVSMVGEMLQTAAGFADLDPSPADLARLRRIIPWSGIMVIRRLFDMLQEHAEHAVREGD